MAGSEDILLIDVGIGNIRSVRKALEKSGGRVQVSNSPEKLLRAGKAVLPGVGAFGDFMHRLAASNLQEAITAYVASGKPLLGICVGMQALFDFSSEYGKHPGLGIIPGKVTHFPAGNHLKIPQTGWNQIDIIPGEPLFRSLLPGAYVYFNHAFYCLPDDPTSTIAFTTYGIRYTSAISINNVWGVQFHPEKSQEVGLTVLGNFVRMAN